MNILLMVVFLMSEIQWTMMENITENSNGTSQSNQSKITPIIVNEDCKIRRILANAFVKHRKRQKQCPSYLENCCTSEDIVSSELCGIRNIDGLNGSPISGKSNEAEYGEFPWTVAVLMSVFNKTNTTLKFQCGASLIHPNVALTGAHCVLGKDNLTIRAGEWDMQTKSEKYETQEISVSQVIIHEDFRLNSLFNDIALLVLKSAVNMSQPNVGTICLPEANENIDGRNCVASGWGKNQFGKEGTYQVIMKKLDLPIVSRPECEASLRKTKLGKDFILHNSFICAGGIAGHDTCQGDGGSPLVCTSAQNPDQYEQVGVVAWGIGCATEVPSVYVNIPLFVPWIKHQMNTLNISIAS